MSPEVPTNTWSFDMFDMPIRVKPSSHTNMFYIKCPVSRWLRIIVGLCFVLSEQLNLYLAGSISYNSGRPHTRW